MKCVNPFLKWPGSKRQLLPQLLELVPRSFNRYHESFVGAGSLYFALKSLGRATTCFLNDSNEELMTAYHGVCSYTQEVINFLKEHQIAHSEAHFYRVRSQSYKLMSEPAATARMIYLNKTAFNGLYRVNREGVFNTPWGARNSNVVLDQEGLLACAEVLADDTRLSTAHYLKVTQWMLPGDFVYFDPPYLPIKSTSYTSYTSGGFREDDHRELARLAHELVSKGVHVMVSNSDMPLIRELYQGFRLHEVTARRNIGGKATGRAPVTELILVGTPEGTPQ